MPATTLLTLLVAALGPLAPPWARALSLREGLALAAEDAPSRLLALALSLFAPEALSARGQLASLALASQLHRAAAVLEGAHGALDGRRCLHDALLLSARTPRGWRGLPPEAALALVPADALDLTGEAARAALRLALDGPPLRVGRAPATVSGCWPAQGGPRS
jgi:hypothetical protein